MKKSDNRKDIQALSDKIEQLRSAQKPTPSLQKSQGTSLGVKMAADLLSGVIVGGGIGFVLDRWFGSRPICLALFLLFGGAAGFLNVYRSVKGQDKDTTAKE